MHAAPPDLARSSDYDLLAALHRLAAEERQVTAQLIAVLAEMDARRLYLAEGCSSLFTYCTQVLQLSEHAAYGRIEAARAARRFPVILERLSAGEITLTAIGLLAPHLTDENHGHLLDAARHKAKRDVEHLVATIRPQPDIRTSVRKVPVPVSRAAARLVSAIADVSSAAAAPVGGEAGGATSAETGGRHAACARAIQSAVHCKR